MNNKKQLGQYYTKKNLWLMPQVLEFIRKSNCNIAYDPFAGVGDLLKCSDDYGIQVTVGLDIDTKLNWKINDSLKNIPHIDNAIIITNPPYLTNYSARRKHIIADIEEYFNEYTDLYQLALVKMLEAQDYVVAIIPETFINSKFINSVKSRINNITILLHNPFEDTENPVCVVCFDKTENKNRNIKVYQDDKYVNSLDYLCSKKLKPRKNHNINFNIPTGKLALRAVDMPSTDKKIKFMNVSELKYDLSNIKNSSRLITIVDIPNVIVDIDVLAEKCNNFLYNYRKETCDINFSPFKGNAKDGTRRRRIDYKQARAIIEQVLDELCEVC